MKRRSFLTTAGAAAALPAATTPTRKTSAWQLPRKVNIGTVVHPFWEKHPGLEKRLAQLTGIVDRMAADSKSRLGRGLDLAILPETSISGEAGNDVNAVAVPFEGAVHEAFAHKAREHNCYIVVASFFREPDGRCTNSAVLVDRTGKVAGIYRKIHLVPSLDGRFLEGGSTAGKDAPVFDCDFGKLGMQICYDMEFDPGWRELARKGAELIAWPTQSPQTSQPAARAMQQRAYIVSSTWRHNATVFEPTGKICAQVKPPDHVLACEIDLSYAILPWTSKLRKGQALKDEFGDKVGFRYYEDEDLGIFWSNDPKTSIGKMVHSFGLLEAEEQLDQVRGVYHKSRVLDY